SALERGCRRPSPASAGPSPKEPDMFALPIAAAFRSRVLLVGTLLLFVGTVASADNGDPQVGSPNTATADPKVPRPAGRSCGVALFTDFPSAAFSPKPSSYTPAAACPGPWAKVVFEGDFSVTAGRQFDRTANVWIGGTNVYFGTTAEPSSAVSPSWHVE